jgi:hypothetical protein
MSEKPKRINMEMTEGMSNTTPQASLSFIDRFFEQSGLSRVINEEIGARGERGASDSEHIKALVMTQIYGGDAIEHQKYLPERAELLGIKIPSVSASRAYMQSFHNCEEDKNRGMGRSYVPLENGYLSGFSRVHEYLLNLAHKLQPKETITLDQDATFIQTTRPDACFNYRGEKSYESFNTYCPEYDLMVGAQYRDGNVSPGYNQLGELKRILSSLPEGVKNVKLRSDSAGYQIDLMKYCAAGDNKRFGAIKFGISVDVGNEFKEAALRIPEKSWRPLRRKPNDAYTQEWAEVAYASNMLCRSKKDPEIRFYAIREVFSLRMFADKSHNDAPGQMELEIDMTQSHIEELESQGKGVKKLHLTLMSKKAYKVFGLASNMLGLPGDEIIFWHRGRCGKSEQAHDILKNDFGGGHVPSYMFGVNAAWWNIAVLAMNRKNMLKRFFLPDGFENCRMKALRNIFYTLTGKIVHHARRITLKIYSMDSGAKLLMYALSHLARLLPCAT